VITCQSKKSYESDLCLKYINEQDIKCGSINVPVDYENPENGTMNLAYLVLACNGPACKDDPLVFLQGGPGGSATALSEFWQSSPLRTDRDIILVDQRGTGYSNAQCPWLGESYFNILKADLTPEEETIRILEKTAVCKEEMKEKGLRAHIFNSIVSVKDLERLRLVLNYNEWNLYGASYGSRLALTYMREQPEPIRAVIMQGIFPPEVNMYENVLTNFKRSLELLMTKCENEPYCNSAYPNFRSGYWELLSKLRTDPVELSDGFVLNAQDFILLSHFMLYQASTAGRIPAIVSSLETDTPNLEFELGILRNTLNIINGPVYLSVMAYEELPFSGLKHISDELQNSPELDPGHALFMGDPVVLSNWHSFRAPPIESIPVKSDLPVLLLNGELDPITPPTNAKELERHLLNLDKYTFANQGHSFFNTCFFQMTRSFLNDPAKELIGNCHNDMISIPWQ
jgi:pimeloyl-ACP methyl ester carboxylesterase